MVLGATVLGLGGVAQGAETATLLDGPTLLDGCLGDPDCDVVSRETIADGLRDAGLASEHIGIGTHAALAASHGVALEIGAQSYALPPGGPGVPPLGVGIAPVVPRLGIGFVGGDLPSRARAALAFHGAPPIPMGDDMAWSAGAQISLAWSDAAANAWAGIDLDLALSSARGSLLDRGLLEGLDTSVSVPRCPKPCADRFEGANAALGTTFRFDIDELTPVFAGLGGVLSTQTLTAAIDSSTWRWVGLQPRARLGIGYRPAPQGLMAVAFNGGWKGATERGRSRLTWAATAVLAWTVASRGDEPPAPMVAPPAPVVVPPAALRLLSTVERTEHPELTCERSTLPTGQPPPLGLEGWCVRVADHGEVMRHGVYVRWWEPDQVAERGQYLDGQMTGTWSQFDPQGVLVAQGPYAKGPRHGIWTTWFASGRIESQGEYLRGKAHGPWVYHSDLWGGRTEGTWVNGQRTGSWLDFGPDGEPRGERVYRDGRLLYSSGER